MAMGARVSKFGWLRNGYASKFIAVLFFGTLSIMCAMAEETEERSGEKGLPALNAVATSNLKFTNSIYQILSQKEGNIFFSPISMEVILALTSFGARGETAAQMSKGLHLPDDKLLIEHGFQALMHALQSDQNITLNVANKIFTDNLIPLKKEFLALAQKSFASSAQGVDFNGNPEAARNQINQWVEEKTNKKITDLIAEGLITSDTAVVLVNAIHFKSDWATKFNASNTRAEPFFVTPTKSKEVQMMNSRAMFTIGYCKETDSKVLELPYKGDKLSLVVMLPRKRDGLATLEANLSSVNLKQLLRSLEKVDVEVSIPKFKLTQFIDLNDVLKKLGMVDMFGKSADFSGLTDVPVRISNVLHKAFIEVDEEGSEASAATSVLSDRRSLPQRFEANHPFVFGIVERRLGTPLFIGRYVA